MSENPTNYDSAGHGETPTERPSTEVVQTKLILGNVPDVAPYPPNWEEAGGVEFFYRTRALLVRDWNVANVRELLGGRLGIEPNVEDLPGSLTRLTWIEGPDVIDVIELLENGEGGTPLQPGILAPEHLMYVCYVKSCAAVEPEPVAADAAPYPRPQQGQDAADPRCRHGAGTRVLIIDTGLVPNAATDHAWLADVTGDLDVLGNPPNRLQQDAGHGTFTTGCVRVTAPESDVHVVNGAAQMRAPVGAGFETDLADLVRAHLTPVDDVPLPDVVVLNFAGATFRDAPATSFAALYDDLIQHLKGVLLLSPAGNEGTTLKNWPASFSWVVSVGALAANWRDRASWSNYGRHVDVYAPGEDLVNAYATGDYTCTWDTDSLGQTRTFEGMAKWSGTSFATPLVAGLVASRVSRTGQNSKRAWQSLLDLAERQAVPGVGPVLYPGQG